MNQTTESGKSSSAYDDLLAIFSGTSLGLLYQLAPHLLSEENQAILDDLVGKAKVEFISYLERAESAIALNQEIEQWRNRKTDVKKTFVIIKIINYTARTFKIAQSSLPFSESERDSFKIHPNETTAFNCTFQYDYAYPWAKNKIIFNQFVDFTEQDINVRLDLGLVMNTSFGVLTPTLRPSIKNTVTSIGQSRINCSTKITRRSDQAPFNFEIEIILG